MAFFLLSVLIGFGLLAFTKNARSDGLASGGSLQGTRRPPGGISGRVRPTEQGREAREKSDVNADQAQNSVPRHCPRSG